MSRLKESMYWMLGIIGAIILVCGFFIHNDIETVQRDIKESSSMEQDVFETPTNQTVENADKDVDSPKTPQTNRVLNTTKLQKISPQATRWLTIPGTSINQPVMQEKQEGSYYYLSHKPNGQYSVAGSLFSPYTKYETGELLIFGHYLGGYYGDGMFTNLNRWYGNAYQADAHKYAYLYDGDIVYKYRIYGAKYTWNSDSIYNMPKPLNTGSYERYIDGLNTLAYTRGEKPKYDQKTLVLSTCTAQFNSQRFVVVFSLESTFKNG